MAVRRGRLKPQFRDETLLDLSLLPIRVDPDVEKFTWSTTLQLAAQHRLTLYDATYLELAKRRGCRLQPSIASCEPPPTRSEFYFLVNEFGSV